MLRFLNWLSARLPARHIVAEDGQDAKAHPEQARDEKPAAGAAPPLPILVVGLATDETDEDRLGRQHGEQQQWRRKAYIDGDIEPAVGASWVRCVV